MERGFRSVLCDVLPPVPLEEGWLPLMWDMMSKKLHVLDPLTGRDGPSMQNQGEA